MTPSSGPTLDHGADSWTQRPEFQESLGLALARSLKRWAKRDLITDCGDPSNRRVLNGGKLLAVALGLAERWRDWPEKRIGIVLPPGAGGALANLAVVLAGKIPVNLNFTAGRAAVNAAIAKGGIQRVISSPLLKARLPDFPWPEDTLDLAEQLKSLSKPAIIWRIIQLRFRSAEALLQSYGHPVDGGDQEASLIFTSGSVGEPKGATLTHRNILSNTVQIAEVGILPPGHLTLANLPLFHSFGQTTLLWYPLLYGIPVVTLPTPLDIKRNIQVIAEEQINILVGSPTFFRPYLKVAAPEQLQTVRYIVAGAEKTPLEMKRRWEEKFGSVWLEGYGVTEASPVIGVNLTTAPDQRTGSIGRLLPGMAARIRNPDTGELNPLDQTGLLEVRGPNIIPGYLDDPARTEAAFADGWYNTGDLGRIDEDGFVYIEGRLSRFSKIGGEMVPHGAIEDHILAAYGWEEEEALPIAISSVADEAKGESLVLLTAKPIDGNDLRNRLGERGVPNLWIPKQIAEVEAIPVLGTGKLDLKAVKTLAEERFGGE